MGFQFLADTTVVLHFVFVLFAVFGGLLVAWRAVRDSLINARLGHSPDADLSAAMDGARLKGVPARDLAPCLLERAETPPGVGEARLGQRSPSRR
jgi:hypothetical protein